jgi:hypothetical protein
MIAVASTISYRLLAVWKNTIQQEDIMTDATDYDGMPPWVTLYTDQASLHGETRRSDTRTECCTTLMGM